MTWGWCRRGVSAAEQTIVTDKRVSKVALDKLAAVADDRFNAVVQLGLQCASWQKPDGSGVGVPQTHGELAWEEHFVGPMVTKAFERLFVQGSTLTWQGCVARAIIVCGGAAGWRQRTRSDHGARVCMVAWGVVRQPRTGQPPSNRAHSAVAPHLEGRWPNAAEPGHEGRRLTRHDRGRQA